MINFCKNVSCPPSQDLLAFQCKETPAGEKSALVASHLAECEFCAAEVEFYEHFPQSSEECPESQIPAALYELAEALLNNRQKNFSTLNKLLTAESVKI